VGWNRRESGILKGFNSSAAWVINSVLVLVCSIVRSVRVVKGLEVCGSG